MGEPAKAPQAELHFLLQFPSKLQSSPPSKSAKPPLSSFFAWMFALLVGAAQSGLPINRIVAFFFLFWWLQKPLHLSASRFSMRN